MFGMSAWKQHLPPRDEALPGREQPLLPSHSHHVLGGSLLDSDYPQGEMVLFGMGCFWGAEPKFWSLSGVLTTAAGYAGGCTPNPTYREVCSGQTGHAEVVQLIYNPGLTSLENLLQVFWESHDPTQGMRQGNDAGTQYRSAIYTSNVAQLGIAENSAKRYQTELDRAGHHAITTKISIAGPFYYAEDEHQQYLSKNPGGYCGLSGTGVSCPVGLDVARWC
jgi:peptide-methionine (S)-S-oxide reductase